MSTDSPRGASTVEPFRPTRRAAHPHPPSFPTLPFTRDMSDHPLPISDSDTSLLIAETFVSLQGEGKLTGLPSWFVRTSGCNLRCAWCDTPYASWNPEGARRTVDDLAGEAERAVRANVRHAVVTGGEPMIFDPVLPLCARLRDLGMHVTIETAGTIFRPVGADLMSISPKLAGSTPAAALAGDWAARHEARRINLPALQQLIDSFSDHQLKFVVSSENDLAEIDSILLRLTGWRPADVLLMPEGTRLPDRRRSDPLVAACLARGWRYCHRLHIELFGNTRGT